ncbi:MAG: hypothetical protein ABI927_04295 [Gaiellaceae bacterium]
MTRLTLVASYPRVTCWIRGVIRLQNAGLRLLRREFRVFVHDPDASATTARENGLHRVKLHRARVSEGGSLSSGPEGFAAQ